MLIDEAKVTDCNFDYNVYLLGLGIAGNFMRFLFIWFRFDYFFDSMSISDNKKIHLQSQNSDLKINASY